MPGSFSGCESYSRIFACTYVHVCASSFVYVHIITVYIIAVKTKMCLEMFHIKKVGITKLLHVARLLQVSSFE